MRKLLLKIHLVLALVCGVFIVIMGLSGSILVFRTDLERTFLPAVTAPAVSTGSAALDLGTLLDRYRASHPGAIVRSIALPAPGTRDAIILVTAGGSDPGRVYLDPATGRELGRRTSDSDWIARLTNLHHTLFADGHSFTGLIGAALSIMCLTGIITWWPGRNALPRSPAFRFRRSGRLGARDLHHLFGFWSFVLLFVLAFTGTVFTWRDAYNRVAAGISGRDRAPAQIKIEGDATDADLNAALAAARRAVPAGVPTLIRTALKPGDPIIIRLKLDGELRRAGSTQVFIDADSQVAQIDRLADAALAFQIVDAFAPIHCAEVGGLPVKVLWTFVGIVPVVLFVSGFRIWWRSLAIERSTVARSLSSSARPASVETLE
jgi:uncharacterized iron-regulated membrane protein